MTKTATKSPVQQTYRASGLPKRLRDELSEDGDTVEIVEAPVGLPKKRRLLDIIGTGAGGFKDRQEADEFIKKLRDEWPE